MSACGTCEHWNAYDKRTDYFNAVSFVGDKWSDEGGVEGFGGYIYGDKADLLFGRCEGVVEGWDHDPNEPLPLAVVRDGSEYRAVLYTRAEFSCALWKAKA